MRAATIAFFSGLFLIGLAVHRDYGISWDEVPTREFGVMNVEGAVPDVRTLDAIRAQRGPAYERFGPLYEILLVRAEKALNLSSSRSVFFMRHLVTFLTFWLGVFLFHRLCRRRFGDGIALLACVSLAASPQMFSHAFYNTKDIPFLAAFVGAMLALDAALGNPSWRPVVVHGVTTAVLLGTRVIGGFAMLLTAAGLLAKRPTRRTVGQLAAYGGIVLVLLPVVWPVLRIDPIGIAKGAVLGAASNPYTKTNLFGGEAIPASQLPWDYVPRWILITTPMVLTALFFLGLWRAALACVRSPRASFLDEPRDVLVLAWFFCPVLGAMVLRPILYDGWRHLFFVYPAFIYVAAIGMQWLWSMASAYVGLERQRAVAAAATGALVLGLSPALVFMIRNHPHEHLYFNRLAGRDMEAVKQRYELDYWGLSYRQALEYIVRSDATPVIRVRVAHYPGLVNTLMLHERDQMRLRLSMIDEGADYFVSNYRFHPEAYPYPSEVFAVRIGNASAVSVFRMRAK